MNLKYWYFQDAVPERICDEIIDYLIKGKNSKTYIPSKNIPEKN